MALSASEIREVRAALNLSQAQLGLLLDAHTSTVQRWERGKTQPSPLQDALLCRFLDATRTGRCGDVAAVLTGDGPVQALYVLLRLALS